MLEDEVGYEEDVPKGGISDAATMIAYVCISLFIGTPAAMFYWDAFGEYTTGMRVLLSTCFTFGTLMYIFLGVICWLWFVFERSRYGPHLPK